MSPQASRSGNGVYTILAILTNLFLTIGTVLAIIELKQFYFVD